MTLSQGCARLPHFDPSGTTELPPAARLWLNHALEPGAALHQRAEYRMHGEILIGRWRSFTAEQSLAPGREFVWRARTKIARLPVAGSDRYADGAGAMRWRMLGFIPVLSAAGADVTESAAGRLASESVLLPSSLLDVEWTHIGTHRAAFVQHIGERSHRVIIEVAGDGALRRVSLQRWGNPRGGPFGYHLFSVRVDAEKRFGDQLIPARFSAMWPSVGTPDSGEFFRAEIEQAVFG